MPFSVLISIYAKEQPEYLQESLESVFNQTLSPDEVIIVEDGSLTPSLYSVLEKYSSLHPELKRIPLSKNLGLGRALNEGLRHCSYDLVARMDTDDVCFPDRFATQVEYMDSHPDVSVVGCATVGFECSIDNEIYHKFLPTEPDEVSKYAGSRCPTSHPGCMFRKKDVLAAGGYIHQYLLEDYYLWVRMLAKGMKIGNIGRPLLYFRTSPDMYRRRGGLKYAQSELDFIIKMYHLGINSIGNTIKAIFLRIPIRLLPNFIRQRAYLHLRNKNKK